METESELTQEYDEQREAQFRLGKRDGRTAIEVPGEALQEYDTSGWIRATDHNPPPRKTPQPRTNGEATTIKKHEPRTSKAQFAQKVTASMTRAARMPASIPREENKVILRPRGGLDVSRVDAQALMSAISAATNMPEEEALQDTVCANAAQNIIVISTPSKPRSISYARVQTLTIGDQTFGVSAYHAAPEGSVKGVIHDIANTIPMDVIRARVMNERNPTVMDVQRIGNSSAIIVLFRGNKVPDTVIYGNVVKSCNLYRQHHQVCRLCGKLGHRQDVCPNPSTRICFACGKPNPDEGHAELCKPYCKLCGGKHPTGAPGCTNRYKMPYEVKKRRWEREQTVSEKREHVPRKSAASFPPLEPKGQRGRSNSCTRSGSTRADQTVPGRRRSRSASRRRRSASDRRESRSRSGERVRWADVVKSTTKRQPSRERKQPRPTEDMQALREMVTELLEENRRLNRRIEELTKQVSTPTRARELPAQPKTAPFQWVQGQIPCPHSLMPKNLQPPSPPMTPPSPPPRVQQQQQQQPQAPQPKKMKTQRPSPVIDMEDQEEDEISQSEDEGELEPEERSEDEQVRSLQRRNKRVDRVSNATRIRRCNARIGRLERRMDAFEKRQDAFDARMDALEKSMSDQKACLDALMEFLHRKLGRDEETTNACNLAVSQQQHQPSSSWPPNPQKQ